MRTLLPPDEVESRSRTLRQRHSLVANTVFAFSPSVPSHFHLQDLQIPTHKGRMGG